MKLLFRTAEWHSFGKLRMHTASTLDHLEALTKEFGTLTRQFRDLTCTYFQTFELPREVAARKRKQGHTQTNIPRTERSDTTLSAASSSTATHRNAPPPGTMPATSASSSRKVKSLNLMTPKFHFLGDYVRTIQMFGCTDNFSTQLVWDCSSLCTQDKH
jgi:hypothetical protein